jgi:tetratricopeptide (TPR) repeat protein
MTQTDGSVGPGDATVAPTDGALTGAAGSAQPPANDAERALEAGLAACERGDFAAAARAFEEGFAAHPSLAFAFNAGRMHERLADVDLGVQWYQRALTFDPTPEQRADLARRVVGLRDYARRQREGFAQPPPGEGALAREALQWFLRGTRMFQLRRYDAALQAFHAAAQYNEDIPELQFNLAVTHERLGRRAEALGAFQNYLALRPDAPDRRDLEQRMQSLAQGP